MKTSYFIFTLTLLLFSISILAQDEGYTNERRYNAIEDGLFHYSIGVATDLDSRDQLSVQIGRTPLSNFTFGGSFTLIDQPSRTWDYSFGLGMFLRNHFLNGRYRPFVEPQMSIINIGISGQYLEASVSSGVSLILSENRSPLILDLFAQYFGPFGSFEERDSGLLISLRFGGYF